MSAACQQGEIEQLRCIQTPRCGYAPEARVVVARTKSIPVAFLLDVSLFRFASVISLSASRCVSFAFAHVVRMLSCLTSDVTKFRRSACLCAELRLRCLYLTRPPAILETSFLWGDGESIGGSKGGSSRTAVSGRLEGICGRRPRLELQSPCAYRLTGRWPELNWEIFGGSLTQYPAARLTARAQPRVPRLERPPLIGTKKARGAPGLAGPRWILVERQARLSSFPSGRQAKLERQLFTFLPTNSGDAQLSP